MELKISDMLDSSVEIIEDKDLMIEDCDFDRIKCIVSEHISCKRKWKKLVRKLLYALVP